VTQHGSRLGGDGTTRGRPTQSQGLRPPQLPQPGLTRPLSTHCVSQAAGRLAECLRLAAVRPSCRTASHNAAADTSNAPNPTTMLPTLASLSARSRPSAGRKPPDTRTATTAGRKLSAKIHHTDRRQSPRHPITSIIYAQDDAESRSSRSRSTMTSFHVLSLCRTITEDSR
jgi:hypothetical protein